MDADELKRAVARAALDHLVPGAIVGVGSGSTVNHFIEALGAGYLGELTNGVFGSNYQDVFAFMVLILVLVFRPAGLLGERVAHRA